MLSEQEHQVILNLDRLGLSFFQRNEQCGFNAYTYLGAIKSQLEVPKLGDVLVYDPLDEIGVHSLREDYGQSSSLRVALLPPEAFQNNIRRLKVPLPSVPEILVGVLKQFNGIHGPQGFSFCGVQVPRERKCVRPLCFMTCNVLESHGRQSNELVVGLFASDKAVFLLDTQSGETYKRTRSDANVTQRWESIEAALSDILTSRS
jgi:hypothetical protein